MGLKEDAKKLVREAFSEDVADQLDIFEDSTKYPAQFLDECVYFIGNLIGQENSKKKFQPLYKRYAKNS